HGICASQPRHHSRAADARHRVRSAGGPGSLYDDDEKAQGSRMRMVIASAMSGAMVATVLSAPHAPAIHGPTGRAPAPAAGAAGAARQWDAKAAAGYLDGRAAWWMTWPNAVRDHGTFCVSCHTAAPYVLARPALRPALAEREPGGV